MAKRLRDGAFSAETELLAKEVEEEEEEEPFIIRTKTFPFRPMSPEEAILQMNLLDHQFFVFRNAEDFDRTCVIYSGKDGAYGLLLPDQ